MLIILALDPGRILSLEPVEHPEHPREYRRVKYPAKPFEGYPRVPSRGYSEFWEADEQPGYFTGPVEEATFDVETFSPFWKDERGQLHEILVSGGRLPPGEFRVYFLER